MTPREFLARIKSGPRYAGQIEACRQTPGRTASFASPTAPLPPKLAAILAQRGVNRLYAHQAEAMDRARRGENLMVVTGTASGKTLCYNLPVVERLMEQREARALYLYPTKALAQDQLGKLIEWGLFQQMRPATYDGDTPRDVRRSIRRDARVIFTNPDMLHQGILPNAPLWGRFFAQLTHVVVDEAHAYRGVFGSHVSLVLRRLRRLCQRHGSKPQFILTSATLANPREHGERLLGLPVSVIDQDGAPSGERTFVIWNPPLLSKRGGGRQSVNIEAARLIAALSQAGIRHLTFVRARQQAELILRYAREELADEPALRARLAAYRAGYTPQQRRELEQRLFSGELLGVTTTTALEMGIDVGGLDACVMVGYPGTLASTWQQAGRAGRGMEPSLAILIVADDPLDQFLARHPEFLFQRPVEQATVDWRNPHILARHLACAAVEAPLEPGDEAFFGEGWQQLASLLEGEGYLLKQGERYMWDGAEHPAGAVNLRSVGGRPYRIVDVSAGDRLLGTVDADTALQVVYPGAQYLHLGESYLIEKLDLEERVASARPAELPYYTRPRVHSSVRVLEAGETDHLPSGAVVGLGQVRVTRQTIGYRKHEPGSERLLEMVNVDLPATSYDTEGMWISLSALQPGALAREIDDLNGALHAVEHSSIAMAPLFAMCDRRDLDGVSHPNHPDLQGPGLFLYDAYPGGVGIAARCYDEIASLLARTLATVGECGCEEGCPACIHSSTCGSNNEGLSKGGAVALLRLLLRDKLVEAAPAAGELTGADGRRALA